jgi:murein L,D-transpeptidase YafK
MAKGLIVAVALCLVAALSWANWPEAQLPEGTRADGIVLRKSEHVLELYSGKTLLRSYRVAIGRGPILPKVQEGDARTPEGHYVIDYRNPQSSFHRSLHVSYPSPSDAARAHALGVKPGGLIMVHGLRNGLGFLGRLHTVVDWTDGCIAVTNSEIEELWRAVPDGTPIDIER